FCSHRRQSHSPSILSCARLHPCVYNRRVAPLTPLLRSPFSKGRNLQSQFRHLAPRNQVDALIDRNTLLASCTLQLLAWPTKEIHLAMSVERGPRPLDKVLRPIFAQQSERSPSDPKTQPVYASWQPK